MIKKGVYGCLGIFIFWILLLILQIWFAVMSAEFFIKLTFTLAGLFIALLATVIVIDQYKTEKKLKDDNFLDG